MVPLLSFLALPQEISNLHKSPTNYYFDSECIGLEYDSLRQ